MLVLHAAAAVSLGFLYRNAPCWMQKVVVGLLFSSVLVLVYVYVDALTGARAHWMVKRAALEIEHIAVLLYVFRLIHQRLIAWTSSAPSRSSLP
jgi:hypothetical protein